ncbi:MAG: phage tail protein [Halanaerobiales bacterium]|nr:phage tail protein [Halanaerobiales bacterium]
MSEPFLGEIKAVGFNFAPVGWAKCYGQLIDIAQNTALYALLGTYYGGDGRVNFGLPDLRGRAIVGEGQGPGLIPKSMGERSGIEYATLSVGNMPSHTHGGSIGGTATGTFKLDASTQEGTDSSPADKIPAKSVTADLLKKSINSYTDASNKDTQMAQNTVNIDLNGGTVQVDPNGSGQAFPIRNPYQVLNYIIATTGLFPSRQ